PDRCVRYDVNAVYLGTPGANQDCPAGLVGRADTISIGAPTPPGAPIPSGGLTSPGGQASPRGLFQDAQQQEFSVDMPDTAPPITATYGTAPDLVEQLLASVRPLSLQRTPPAWRPPT